MYISSKQTLYIVDGSNFLYSVFKEFSNTIEEAEGEMIEWFNSLEGVFSFMVFLDGSERGNFLNNEKVNIIFSKDKTADERILEYLNFCEKENIRTIIVTDDKKLKEDILKDKFKVLNCKKFFKTLNNLNNF